MNRLSVVNYITRNGWRPTGQERLQESLRRVNFDGNVFPFHDGNLSCPSHREIPYAFKMYSLKQVFDRGNKLLVWVDASFWAIRNLDGLADLIREKKIVVQSSGYPVGQWTSDDCLKRMNLNREDAFKIPMFSGGLIGLDMTSQIAKDFLLEWFRYAKDGRCFRGAWRNRKKEVSNDSRVLGHRHDMSVGSILLHRMNQSMMGNNRVFAYYSWYKTYKDKMDLSHLYFLCEGGPRKLPLKEIDL